MNAFCSLCQEDTDHSSMADINGELVLTCPNCEHFVKFPAGTGAKQLAALLAEHKNANTVGA